MADNVDLASLAGRAATEECAFSGETNAHVQLMRAVGTAGAEGSRTVVEPPPLGRASGATITTTNLNTSNVTLKAAGAARYGLHIVNDADQILYVKFGAVATADDWTLALNPGERHFEPFYTGRIDGIWAASGSGKARVTELTA